MLSDGVFNHVRICAGNVNLPTLERRPTLISRTRSEYPSSREERAFFVVMLGNGKKVVRSELVASLGMPPLLTLRLSLSIRCPLRLNSSSPSYMKDYGPRARGREGEGISHGWAAFMSSRSPGKECRVPPMLIATIKHI